MSFYDTGFNNSKLASSEIAFLCGALYLIYYFLDCVDGKQARRLGLGSTLGFFMDHNLDSFSCVLLTLTCSNILNITEVSEIIPFYLMTNIPFFFCTWEEYVTGVMEFPIFSGVDEGAIVSSFVLMITGILGTDIWVTKTVYGVPILKAIVLLAIVFCIGFFVIRYDFFLIF